LFFLVRQGPLRHASLGTMLNFNGGDATRGLSTRCERQARVLVEPEPWTKYYFD